MHLSGTYTYKTPANVCLTRVSTRGTESIFTHSVNNNGSRVHESNCYVVRNRAEIYTITAIRSNETNLFFCVCLFIFGPTRIGLSVVADAVDNIMRDFGVFRHREHIVSLTAGRVSD